MSADLEIKVTLKSSGGGGGGGASPPPPPKHQSFPPPKQLELKQLQTLKSHRMAYQITQISNISLGGMPHTPLEVVH